MLNIRGLWRAITSVRPRYALLHCPRRNLASSFTWRSIKQSQSRHISGSNVERVVEPRKRNDGQPDVEATEYEGHKLKEDAKIIVKENGDSNTAISPEGGSSAALEEAAETNDNRTRDLCNSVTATMAKLPHPVVVITTLDRTYQAQEAAGVPIEETRHPIARGITASSFTSLCVRPRPHVMFNMTLPSTMYEALVACRDFNVHVLTPDKYGAQIASVFTRGNRLPPLRLGDSERPVYAFDIDADLGVFVGLKGEGLPYAEIANRDAWHKQYQDGKGAALRVPVSLRGIDPMTQDSKVIKPVKQFHPVPCIHSRGIMEVLHCHLVRTIHPELTGAGQNAIIIGEVVQATTAKIPDEKPSQAPVALGYADRKYRSIGAVLDPHEKDTFTG